MTLDELKADAWRSLPPIRKRLAGRLICDELVAEAVRNWSGDYIASCHDDAQRVDYAKQLLEQVRHSHELRAGMTQPEYGFIWVFLLTAVASALIQWLIKRWLDNHFDAEQMQAWQRELAS